MNKIEFCIFIVLGLFIRITYSSFSFHPRDLNSWMYLGDSIYKYHISPFLWWSQGPINAIPLMCFQFLNYLGLTNKYYISVSYHLPLIIGDLLLLRVVYLVIKDYFPKNRYFTVLIIWFSGIILFVSSVKGQTEQWMVLLTILSFYLISKQNYKLGYICFGCSLLVKYIPILCLPLILLITKDNKNRAVGIGLLLGSLIFGFLSLHFVNLFFFHDGNFFKYFIDRSGTIFGEYLPNLGGKIFISTGASLWGQLFQLGWYPQTVLEIWKHYWVFLYAVIYLFITLIFVFFYQKNKPKFDDNVSRFVLLISYYSLNLSIFMWLYSHTVDHRYLNVIVPLYFLFLYLDIDINLLIFIANNIILSSDLYTKGNLFLLKNSNIYLKLLLWLILLMPQYIFTSFKNRLLVITSLLSFCFIFLLVDARYHPWIFLLTNIQLILVCATLGYKFILDKTNE